MCLLELFAGGVALLVVAFNALLYTARGRALRHVDTYAVEDRLGVVNAAWAFLEECVASAAVVLLIPVGWCVPRCRAGAGTRGPVILVHGWSLNRGSLWLLQRRLVRDGWSPVHCFAYASLSADVAHAAAQLHSLVERTASAATGAISLVGHGLGGLVLRYYARRYPARSVRRLVTLGTPHFGTDIAAWHGRLGAPLAPGSALLSTLNAADRVPQQFDVIAISSTFDALILPPANAEYPGAFNIRLNNIGHNALLFSRKVYVLLRENLAAP